MPDGPIQQLLRCLRRAAARAESSAATDAQLLEHFVARGDPDAFELLTWRHGRAVWGVCRRLLRDEHEAEDAFQATFLALARKARSIDRGESVGGWLYRVAYRVALRAKGQAGQRLAREQAEKDLPARPVGGPDPCAEAARRELGQALDQEVSCLPAKYREAFVLRCLAGKSGEEAARELGCPVGTVESRLTRARERLRAGLARRGFVVPAAGLAAGLAPAAAGAGVATPLVVSTVKAAALVGAGQAVPAGMVPVRAVALMEGVLRAMLVTKLKITAAVLLAAGIVGAGAAGLMRGSFAAGPDDRSQAEKPAQPAGKPGDVEKKPVDPAQLARHRGQSRVNLRKLALAMHAYHDARNQFPMPAIYAKDGKPLLSWRVALLPYLGQEKLYKQFHLGEPWDSPHNKKLLKEMPKVYAPPGVATRQPYATFYQVFVGKRPAKAKGQAPAGAAPAAGAGAPVARAIGGQPEGPHPAFEEHTALPFSQFPDGTSNTILIVEAGKAVPWTKPEDLEYAADRPIPPLGGLFPLVFHAAFADGSVARLWKDFDQRQLRFAITRDDGQPMDRDQLKAPFPLPGADLNAARYAAKLAELKEKNVALKHKLGWAAIQAKQLRAERESLQERAGIIPQPGKDTEADLLTEENKQLQEQLRRAEAVVKQLQKEIQRLKEEVEKLAAEKAEK